MERQLIVPATAAGMRLDRFAQERLQQTRSQIQHGIDDGLITVNGRVVKNGYAVRPNDLVVIREPERVERSAAPEPSIVHETPDYAVLEKPAGLLVYGVARKNEQSVADWALERWPECADVGEHGRSGIVHRLDRDVSGLLLFAKMQDAYAWFKQQFHDRQILKVYTTLVQGNVRNDSGTIAFSLARSRTHHGRMAARPEKGMEGKRAETVYMVLARYTTSTLLSVRIYTGRTHQIRAHLFALGHPIVGDMIYTGKNRSRNEQRSRLFLHAAKLGFSELNGEWKEFSSPLPKELQQYLAVLRTKATEH